VWDFPCPKEPALSAAASFAPLRTGFQRTDHRVPGPSFSQQVRLLDYVKLRDLTGSLPAPR